MQVSTASWTTDQKSCPAIKQRSKVWLLKLQCRAMQIPHDPWACCSSVTQDMTRWAWMLFWATGPWNSWAFGSWQKYSFIVTTASSSVVLLIGSSAIFQNCVALTEKPVRRKISVTPEEHCAEPPQDTLLHRLQARKVPRQVWPPILQKPHMHRKRKSSTESLSLLWYSIINTLKFITQLPEEVAFYCPL